jgi:hypothetical protein
VLVVAVPKGLAKFDVRTRKIAMKTGKSHMLRTKKLILRERD